MSYSATPSHPKYEINHRSHYIDYERLGSMLRQLRERKYGKRSRCEVVRILNGNSSCHYAWDQSQLAKFESGQWHITIDRLCELAMCLSVNPFTVLGLCAYGCDSDYSWLVS